MCIIICFNSHCYANATATYVYPPFYLPFLLFLACDSPHIIVFILTSSMLRSSNIYNIRISVICVPMRNCNKEFLL